MITTILSIPATAEQHRPAPADAEVEFTGWCYNEHNNDLGDWCPSSGKPAPEDSDEGDDCPQMCRRGRVVEACRTCGGERDYEGWDGECGNCADRTENARNRVDMIALQQAIAAAGHVALVAKTSGNTATLFAGRLVAGDEEREVRWSVSAGSGWFEPTGEAISDRYSFGYGHDSNDEDAPSVSLEDHTDLSGLAGAIVRMITRVERQRAAAGVPSASRDLVVRVYGEGVADAQSRVYGQPAAIAAAAQQRPPLRDSEVDGH
ncbi:hypothetical protein [Micromonospora sp. NPDC049662]|uniref:hypothetical protein n=1 Tax=Micromonospora sp. NPDC049662 TaxID=3155397 RepID=UPI003449C1EE